MTIDKNEQDIERVMELCKIGEFLDQVKISIFENNELKVFEEFRCYINNLEKKAIESIANETDK